MKKLIILTILLTFPFSSMAKINVDPESSGEDSEAIIDKSSVKKNKSKEFEFYDNKLKPQMDQAIVLMQKIILKEKANLAKLQKAKIAKDNPHLKACQENIELAESQIIAINSYYKAIEAKKLASNVHMRKWTKKTEGKNNKDLKKYERTSLKAKYKHYKLTGIKMLALKYQLSRYKNTKLFVKFCKVPVKYQKSFENAGIL